MACVRCGLLKDGESQREMAYGIVLIYDIAKTATTKEQTLERCPNLALASAFFAPGTKGLPLVPIGNTSRD